MQEVKHAVPKTSTGLPKITGDIDPYKSCFSAPDHLLKGHARECISLEFKLLPCKENRILCEHFMTGYLKERDLPEQNRILDQEKEDYTRCQCPKFTL